jgi:diguanylate cyclase (GGDEF)-like protein
MTPSSTTWNLVTPPSRGPNGPVRGSASAIQPWLIIASIVVALVFALTFGSERNVRLAASTVGATAATLALMVWLWSWWLERRHHRAGHWRLLALAVMSLAAAELASAGHYVDDGGQASLPLWIDLFRIVAGLFGCAAVFVMGAETVHHSRESVVRPAILAGAVSLALLIAVQVASDDRLSSSPGNWVASFLLIALPVFALLLVRRPGLNRDALTPISLGGLALAFACVAIANAGAAADRLIREPEFGARTSWFLLPAMTLLMLAAVTVLLEVSGATHGKATLATRGASPYSLRPRVLLRVVLPFAVVFGVAAIVFMLLPGINGPGAAALGVGSALVLAVLISFEVRAQQRHADAERHLEEARLELARTNNLDPVTNIPNRRALDQRLAEEVERALRYRQPLGLCFVDLDHFKEVNDRFGHAAGDETLRQVAATMRRTARGIDFVGRYGGEEFVVLVPGTWSEDATTLGERLRRAVELESLRTTQGQTYRVTISVGIAGLPEHARDAESLRDCADRALYAAKQSGRNRVTLFEPEPRGPSSSTSN